MHGEGTCDAGGWTGSERGRVGELTRVGNRPLVRPPLPPLYGGAALVFAEDSCTLF